MLSIIFKLQNMKKFFLLSLIFSLSSAVFAQIDTCIIDTEIWQDSTIGVYPKPYVADSMSGGIPDTACINTDFQTIMNLRITETAEIFGTTVPVVSIKLESVDGLPDGLSYKCNQPDCLYTPGDVAGCITIYGTITDPSLIGDHPIEVSATLQSLISIPITFPDDNIAPGTYSIYVNEEGAANCSEYVNNREILTDFSGLKLFPNPAADLVTIQADLNQAGDYQLEVRNMLGAILLNQNFNTIQGRNEIQFSVEHLENGFYTYTISNEKGAISKTFVVQK